MDKQAYEKTCNYIKQAKQKSLDMALRCGKGGCHIGGGFSCIEILSVLYANFMRHDFKHPDSETRDRFFASKAHCFFAHAAVLAVYGLIPDDELATFSSDSGKMAGKPRKPSRGLEFSGGSLGMGLSLGVGSALWAKRKKLDFKTYVLLGDGECDEGSVWEAIMSAAQFKLDNLTAIVDDNKLQFDGFSADIMNLDSLEEKFKAFGWAAVTVDGHSVRELYDAFLTEHEGKPLAIIAKTVKAHGIERLENKAESHHTELTQEDYDLAVAKLNEQEEF